MVPAVFINCARFPFIDWILSGRKIYETRTRDTLRRFIGQTVYLAETGRGAPVVRAMATIESVLIVRSRREYNQLRKSTAVPSGSSYDWTDDTKKKCLYKLVNVVPVSPFVPSGQRHGRVWMEA